MILQTIDYFFAERCARAYVTGMPEAFRLHFHKLRYRLKVLEYKENNTIFPDVDHH